MVKHVLALLVVAACYRPTPPDGALLCSTGGRCPIGYHCSSDGACWRDGSDAPDAGAGDAGVDTVPFTHAPRLISPRNGATTGTVRAALSRRPLLRWAALPEATSYEVQVDDSCDPTAYRDCSFPSPEATESTTTAFVRLSSGLAVATIAPAGRRYYWRVRGCGGDQCTPWSEARYLDVARNPTDFSGEGDSDLVIGNANATVNGTAAVGSAYIALGGAILPGLPGLNSPTAAFGDHFGVAAASAGDVDGDRLADLAVTGDIIDGSGRVYLYHGTTTIPSGVPALTLANPEGQANGSFGHALVGGDLDGDGHSDLVVGAELQDGAARSEGKVFIYAGQASAAGLPARPTWTLENPGRQERGAFGNALAIGDFDGDGHADLAVAAREQDAIGRVFVYRGGPQGVAATPSVTLDDPRVISNAAFGYALAAGDFDGDGYPDLAIGAALEPSQAGASVGRVYVFRGGPTGLPDHGAPWLVLDNPTGQIGSLFGWGLVAADFNGDTIDDLVVAARGQDQAAGRVYVYQGAATGLPSQPSRTLEDPPPVNANDAFGYLLAVGDHAPADGFVDLFVSGDRDGGTIYLFAGSATGLAASATATITGASVPGGSLGPTSLSSAPP